MKAAAIKNSALVTENVDAPKPQVDEVLIRVRAAGLNRADLITVQGHPSFGHGAKLPVPGLEWAGEIVECGAGVPPEYKPGDRVMATGTSGFAEYAVADWGRVIPIPSPEITFETAATLPLALMTMHDAIVTNGQFSRGQSVLVQGASSGVGLVALQIAKHMGAGLVLGTSTREERRAVLNKYGADHALDSRDPEWADQVRALTDGKGVNLIIDNISGGVMNQNLKAAAVLGRIINVGRLGGFAGELDFDLHALKRISYIGVTFRTRTVEEVREIVRLMRKDLWQAVMDGRIALPIDSTFPLDKADEALRHMQANAHLGKIVLTA